MPRHQSWLPSVTGAVVQPEAPQLKSWDPRRAPRSHPRNSPASALPCPITITDRSGLVSRSLFLYSQGPPPRSWDRVSVGSQHPLLRPAPQTPLWFSVPPSISKDDPTGEVSVKEVKTKVNSTLTLECECWAAPPPTISWYKDGQVSAGPPECPPALTSGSPWFCLEPSGKDSQGTWSQSWPGPCLTLSILIRNPTHYRGASVINIKLSTHPFIAPPAFTSRASGFGFTVSCCICKPRVGASCPSSVIPMPPRPSPSP